MLVSKTSMGVYRLRHRKKIYRSRKFVHTYLLKFAIKKRKEYVAIKSLNNLGKKRGRPKKKKTITVSEFFLIQLFVDVYHSFRLTFERYKKSVFIALTISSLLFAGTYWLNDFVFKDLPLATDLSIKEQQVSTKILDRNGEVLFRIYADENRTILPLSEIPHAAVAATIAIEDKDFFVHHGFSLSGIVRAAISNFQGKSLQGGSTITQQLVKNRLLTSERTVSRKIRELLLSVLVELQYSKEEILEMYLNQVSYGGNAYGIEEASQKFFGKSARELTLAESALLAGLPQSPSTYTPFGSNPELAYARQEEVLRRMVEDGYINPEQAEQAKKEPLLFNEDKVDIQAPHFVMYVRRLLAKQFGEELLNTGGLEVKTTLDISVQQEVEKIVADEIAALGRLNIQNGAALVTNPQTGEILSMVGSIDYFDFANDGQVNVTIRPRQPGSSIKPITYALAIENGKTTQDIIEDSPITYHTLGSKPYSPKNYDGKFHGKVTLKEALASSYNIPAVKTLAEVGITNMIDLAEKMGITTWKDRNRFGLSLTLGGGEITMAEMSEVYGTFANLGKHVELNPILEITDYNGTIYYQNHCALGNSVCEGEQVIQPTTAYLITDILSDNDARTPAFGAFSTLQIPNQEVAVKTGTTNNLRDNWTIGYTTNRLVAVWVGNNDNTPMSYVASGITGASPIWNKIMRLQLSETEPHQFVLPDMIVETKICKNQAYTPCEFCPANALKTEFFVAGTEQQYSCEFAKLRSQIKLKRDATQKSETATPKRGQITPATNTEN
ncbi:MAG: penicillin-binding protein 1A [Patescibacteria group bacterium]|nr:MAG: penicillin-binding protein 1A [Patescibacteria group bacterium]